jgi:hypothetical protein
MLSQRRKTGVAEAIESPVLERLDNIAKALAESWQNRWPAEFDGDINVPNWRGIRSAGMNAILPPADCSPRLDSPRAGFAKAGFAKAAYFRVGSKNRNIATKATVSASGQFAGFGVGR